jgi:hypothetical protein
VEMVVAPYDYIGGLNHFGWHSMRPRRTDLAEALESLIDRNLAPASFLMERISFKLSFTFALPGNPAHFAGT